MQRTIVVANAAAALAFIAVIVTLTWLGVRDSGGPRPSATTHASSSAVTPATQPTAAEPSAAPMAVLVGAGDIADCKSPGDEATADLLEAIEGTVFTLGDNAYDRGTQGEFAGCYGPSWGRASIRNRTRPVAGNHDYLTPGATGYFEYFGAAAGEPGKGYYAYDHGAWRVYVLNSNCAEVGGCGARSAQAGWLLADLAANPRDCALAMWHHARFSSALHGNDDSTEPLWRVLDDADADLILVGHDHAYERFAPQTPSGARDDAGGIVQIVVGTGGRGLYGFEQIREHSLVRSNRTWGVLRLELAPGAYAFEFIPVAGESFTDSGSAACH